MINLTNKEKNYFILLFVAIIGLIYDCLPATINIRGFIEILPISLMKAPDFLAFWLNKFFNILFLYSLFMLIYTIVKEEDNKAN